MSVQQQSFWGEAGAPDPSGIQARYAYGAYQERKLPDWGAMAAHNLLSVSWITPYACLSAPSCSMGC